MRYALDREAPKAAKQVFNLAEPALIRGKAYSLCAKYIDPEADLKEMVETYRELKKLSSDARLGAEHLKFVNQKFANDATTLVAILVLNEKRAEAEKVAKAVRKEWDDAAFQTALDAALDGVVPDPRP